MKTPLLLILLFLAPPGFAQDNWNYSEAVSFKGVSQVHWIVLTDSRVLRVQYPSPENFAEIEESWKPGKKLHIAYRPSAGLVLLDMSAQASGASGEGGKFLPILEWPGEHPIDMIVAECLEQNSAAESPAATQDLAKCFSTGTSYWQMEIARAYKALIESLDAEKKAAVEEAQSEWLVFRDAQIKALEVISIDDSAISPVELTSAIRDLHRDQAKWLFSLLAAS